MNECDLCGCWNRDRVCDRCFVQLAEEREQEEVRDERHLIDEVTARAALGQQLNNPL